MNKQQIMSRQQQIMNHQNQNQQQRRSRRQNHDPLKYKTQLCLSFTSVGECPHGKYCVYAHSAMELRNGMVMRSEKVQRLPCFGWTATGWCPYGNNCTFIHDQNIALRGMNAKYFKALAQKRYGGIFNNRGNDIKDNLFHWPYAHETKPNTTPTLIWESFLAAIKDVPITKKELQQRLPIFKQIAPASEYVQT